jgi:DNA repair exonuclease SbcCD ATPase subunit
MTDDEGQAFFARIEYLEQQLADTKINLSHRDGCWQAAEERVIELKQQLAECQSKAEHWEATCHGQWENYQQLFAECQAREKVLQNFVDVCIELDDYLTITVTDALDKVRDLPSDSTALDSAIKQAKREALLKAIDCARNAYESGDVLEKLLNMVKELE